MLQIGGAAGILTRGRLIRVSQILNLARARKREVGGLGAERTSYF